MQTTLTKNVKTLNHYGKERPRNLPSLCNCVKPSMILTRPPIKRKSTEALSDSGNTLPDEMGLFLQQDSINDFKSLCKDTWEKFLSNKNCILHCSNEYILIQSKIMLKAWSFRHLY